MKFRTGLVIGLGVGYVLGAKAGRERYEQIASCWNAVAGDGGLLATTRARDTIGNGLREASGRVRHAADGR